MITDNPHVKGYQKGPKEKLHDLANDPGRIGRINEARSIARFGLCLYSTAVFMENARVLLPQNLGEDIRVERLHNEWQYRIERGFSFGMVPECEEPSPTVQR